ncbi:ABC transporter permease [Nonomuraea diastatica]|uniref:ABC transporter permease n=1 Tax=Nonomuraea diastatica TaxID=1848329 RepID=A0A4R4W5V0_9ACTN|nr:ABC transporter permease [Nonomuraea diastatica]TDD13952.1 ABC transporter permease [Nonomuraea diastatica]
MSTITPPRRRNVTGDILIVMTRELRPVAGDPFSLVVGLIQPLFFLLLFGPLVVHDTQLRTGHRRARAGLDVLDRAPDGPLPADDSLRDAAPLDEGPQWMRVLAQVNPLTHVVEAERDLFAGQIATPDVGYGFLAAGTTAVLGFVLGLRALRASTD